MGTEEQSNRMMIHKFLTVEQEAYFPNLSRDQYHVTSLPTADYNCIAHAACENTRWWWPLGSGSYWPVDASVETLEAFTAAYGTCGFSICDKQSRDLEVGVERVAIYVDVDGVPTHAARQLPNGRWTSKLGRWEDIQHDTLEAIEDRDNMGLGYGKVALILKRPAPAE